MKFSHPKNGINIFINAFCVCLFILSAFKLIFITTSTPMLGYANNFDFIRQSSCLGLWVYVDGNQSRAASPWTSNAIYDGKIDSSQCQKSIDSTMVSVLLKFHQLGDSVPLKEIGLGRVLILLMLATLYFFCNPSFVQKLFSSLLFFLIFFDIANLLYFNTLYLEASVLIGLYLAIVGLFLLITNSSKSPKKILALLMISFLILGFSKEQYVYLALIFALTTSGVLIFRKAYGHALLPTLFIILAPIAYYSMNSATKVQTIYDINLANKANTYLGAVLPEATNQLAAVKSLGLPENCIKSIGLHWYAAEYQINRPCPEIIQVSRLKLIPLFMSQPSTLINPIMTMIYKIYPLRIQNLAFYEPGNLSSLSRVEMMDKFSLSSVIKNIDTQLFVVLTLIGMGILYPLLGFAYVCVSKRKFMNTYLQGSIISALMGSFILNYAIVSSVFGDGYTEPQKHAFIAIVGFALILIALIFVIFYISSRYYKKLLSTF